MDVKRFAVTEYTSCAVSSAALGLGTFICNDGACACVVQRSTRSAQRDDSVPPHQEPFLETNSAWLVMHPAPFACAAIHSQIAQ